MDVFEKAKKVYLSLDNTDKWPHILRVRYFAEIIADKLRLDKEVLLLAALLHDVGYARGDDNHGSHSAQMAEEWGYPQVSDIVRTHSDFDLCKTDLQKALYDADKLDRTTFSSLLARAYKYRKKGLSEEEIIARIKKKMIDITFHFSVSKEIAANNLKGVVALLREHEKIKENL